MPDPQWENLKEIFHGALALAPQERAAYLERACSGDQSLRQAVESLIKSPEETANFVDVPAYQAAAEMFVDGIGLKAGKNIAHYRIVRLLGEGGMGKVYQAEDTKLHRRVSLKFLSTQFTATIRCSRAILFSTGSERVPSLSSSWPSKRLNGKNTGRNSTCDQGFEP